MIKGASPLIHKESSIPKFEHVSRNPFVLGFEARMLGADDNIQRNF